MRIRRRRRRDYTPEQEAARKNLHAAEMWVSVLSAGFGEQLKREVYCSEGTRAVIDAINAELVDACDALDAAQKANDEAFARTRNSYVSVVKRREKPQVIPKAKTKTKRTPK